jgi:hypothetical protein
MCLTIDTDQLQTAPGSLSTDDGLFHKTPFRPIPQFWQDSLSTLNFGEGRIQNVMYVATANATDGGPAGDVVVIISFMIGGNVEVRILRGAPAMPNAGPPPGAPTSLYGIFSLSLSPGPSACPF